MTTRFQKSVELTTEEKQTLRLDYFITHKKDRSGYDLYGVAIEKFVLNGQGVFEFAEKEAIDNVTYSHSEIDKVVNILINNEVTPVSLICVFDDMDICIEDAALLGTMSS